MDTPTFNTWDVPALVKFAYEANEKLQQQQERIMQLQQERKDAINAYRELLRRSETVENKSEI